MDLHSLLVPAVTQQRLEMLPSVKTANFAPLCVHYAFYGIGLAVAPEAALDARGLDFAVVDDFAVGVYEGLKGS